MYKTMKNSFFLMSIGLISIFSSCKRVYFDTPPLGTCSDESIANLISNDHFVFGADGGTQTAQGSFWWVAQDININGLTCYALCRSDTSLCVEPLYTYSQDTLVSLPDTRAVLRTRMSIDTIATSWFCISTNYGKPATLSITLEKNTTTECRYINMEVWAGNCNRSITIEQEAGE